MTPAQETELVLRWQSWDDMPADSARVQRLQRCLVILAEEMGTSSSRLRDLLVGARKEGLSHAEAVRVVLRR